jgi:prepilin-type processing-associated H-X9-DG protein
MRRYTKKDIFVLLSCVAFLLMNLSSIGNRGRERAKIIVCQTNLKQFGHAQNMYLDDNDDRYPYAWTSLIETQIPVAGYQRYCRWHDPRYPADGPLRPYLAIEKVILCPTFNSLAMSQGNGHPMHDPTIPIVPYYSYSMNAYLGSKPGNPQGSAMQNSSGLGGVYKRSEITRSKAEVFFFAEENMWMRPGNANVLNDNALCPDGRDWFGTFHKTSLDLNAGTVNAVFVDWHVEEVRSALGPSGQDRGMEFGQFEKYGWPNKEPYR